MAQVRSAAESLIAILGDSVPGLRRHAGPPPAPLSPRPARRDGGPGADAGRRAARLRRRRPRPCTTPRRPTTRPAHFDSLLARLDSLLPGRGPLADALPALPRSAQHPGALGGHRVQDRDRRVPRAHAGAHAAAAGRAVRPGIREGHAVERLQLVQGRLSQPDPGEPRLPRRRSIARSTSPATKATRGTTSTTRCSSRRWCTDRGWVEISLYPLFSPQSLIAEGSANYGIDMAFPAAERVGFERDSLFPLARTRPVAGGAERGGAAGHGAAELRPERGRRAATSTGSSTRPARRGTMQRYWLSTPDAAAKTVRFIDTYRELRHQLQPGARPGGGLGGADRR